MHYNFHLEKPLSTTSPNQANAAYAKNRVADYRRDIDREGAERITSALTLTGKAMAFFAFANSVIKFTFT